MKIVELTKVSKNRIGRTVANGVVSERHEDKTTSYLNLFGFDIEKIIPSHTPKSSNPDIFMQGSIWEIKSPTSSNPVTLKNRFRKASAQASQSGKIIFDLRGARKNYYETERLVIKMFEGNRKLRRMILITLDGKVFDYRK